MLVSLTTVISAIIAFSLLESSATANINQNESQSIPTVYFLHLLCFCAKFSCIQTLFYSVSAGFRLVMIKCDRKTEHQVSSLGSNIPLLLKVVSLISLLITCNMYDFHTSGHIDVNICCLFNSKSFTREFKVMQQLICFSCLFLTSKKCHHECQGHNLVWHFTAQVALPPRSNNY